MIELLIGFAVGAVAGALAAFLGLLRFLGEVSPFR